MRLISGVRVSGSDSLEAVTRALEHLEREIQACSPFLGTQEPGNPELCGLRVPRNLEPAQNFVFPSSWESGTRSGSLLPGASEPITNCREKIIKVCANFQPSKKTSIKMGLKMGSRFLGSGH